MAYRPRIKKDPKVEALNLNVASRSTLRTIDPLNMDNERILMSVLHQKKSVDQSTVQETRFLKPRTTANVFKAVRYRAGSVQSFVVFHSLLGMA